MKKLSLFLIVLGMASIEAGQLYTKDGKIQNADFFIVQSQATRYGGQGLAKFEEEHPNAVFIANLSDGSNKMGAVNNKLFVVLSDSAPSNSSSSELEIELNNLKQNFAQLLELLARKDDLSVRNLAIKEGYATGQVSGSKEKYAI